VDRAAAVLSGVLAFFALLALALGLAAGRLAENWAGPRADVATLQVYAPEAEMEDQARAALNVLRTTPGVESVRMIDLAEQGTLLEPWLGPDSPIESLPLPLMIEITTERSAFNAATLLQRLEAEAPGTVYDDHAGWRQPLVATAERLEMFAFAALALLGVALAAGLVLAATAALAASGAAVATLRLVGARDRFILRAVTRRLVLGAVAGGLVGPIAGRASKVSFWSASGSAARPGSSRPPCRSRSWRSPGARPAPPRVAASGAGADRRCCSFARSSSTPSSISPWP
jgi:cell division transport system permease protein